MTTQYRRATPADAAQLAELRAVMMDSISGSESSPDEPWRQSARDWFAEHLGGDEAAAFVADEDGLLVSCALGVVRTFPASPRNASGVVGHVSNVATRPEHRRRGHSRRVLELLVAWFDEHGVGMSDLNATEAGLELYRALGYAEHGEPYLRRQHEPRSEHGAPPPVIRAVRAAT